MEENSLTAASDIPVPTTRTHTAGPRGPLLLQDFHLVEKLQHLNRERITQRVVRAQGLRRLRHLCRHARHHKVHEGEAPVSSVDAVWTYEGPYAAVSAIRE